MSEEILKCQGFHICGEKGKKDQLGLVKIFAFFPFVYNCQAPRVPCCVKFSFRNPPTLVNASYTWDDDAPTFFPLKQQRFFFVACSNHGMSVSKIHGDFCWETLGGQIDRTLEPIESSHGGHASNAKEILVAQIMTVFFCRVLEASNGGVIFFWVEMG